MLASLVFTTAREIRYSILYYRSYTYTYDEVCRRSMIFVVSCQNSDSQLVRYVVNIVELNILVVLCIPLLHETLFFVHFVMVNRLPSCASRTYR